MPFIINHAACNRDTRILDSIIWGGETEFPKSPGHIWFSFLPNIPNKKYTHDDLNLSYVREYSDYVYNYQLPSKDTSNEAELQKYTEHNYVPQQTIKSNTKDGAGKVLNPGVWDNIEVSKSYAGSVPLEYQRKQTLANSERYITPQLKEAEEKILSAKENCIQLEYRLFAEIREKLSDCHSRTL